MQTIVVFAAGWNCKDAVRKHMLSIQKQTFQNYIHIVVDDCTTDGTFDVIKHYADDKTIVIRNSQNRGWIYNAITHLQITNPHHVIALVDLDDWLYDANVLQTIANTYDLGYWVTYGTLIRSTGEVRENNLKGYSNLELNNPNFRKSNYNWRFWALRTFKGFIWHNLNKKDLLGPNKEYPPTSYDWGIGHPIIEMTPPEKICHITDFTYVYNVHELNDKTSKRDAQVYYCNWFKSKEVYKKLPLDYDKRV
jgi:glycosyltransferase involved in cell wall biosynthesis